QRCGTVSTPHALAAQRATLRAGRGQRGADRTRRIATGVRLVAGVVRAVLPIVDVVEAGAVAAAHVQVSVTPEQESADRVAGELLAPVVDEHLFAAGHHVAADLQTRYPCGHQTAVGGWTRRFRTAFAPGRGRSSE